MTIAVVKFKEEPELTDYTFANLVDVATHTIFGRVPMPLDRAERPNWWTEFRESRYLALVQKFVASNINRHLAGVDIVIDPETTKSVILTLMPPVSVEE